MARRKIKWKFGFLFFIILLNVFTKSLPIEKSETKIPHIVTTDTDFGNLELPNVVEVKDDNYNNSEENSVHEVFLSEVQSSDENTTETDDIALNPETRPSNETLPANNEPTNSTGVTSFSARTDLLRQLRPGQDARDYAVEITIDGDIFHGRTVIDVRLDVNTREDPMEFHAEDLNIESVRLGIFTEANAINIDDYELDEGILIIPHEAATTAYIVIIEYTGAIRNDGTGIFHGDFNGHSYLGMNLYPTNARRVFPCVDELTDLSTVKFMFQNVPFSNIIANSMPEDNPHEFHALPGPKHQWGMIAHNFVTVMIPATNVMLFGRSGMNQDAQASVALQFFFNALNEWTDKPYFEIIANQDGRMAIFALTDTSVDWYALSTVCIWEPYIYMESIHSFNQKKIGLVAIAEAMARQWYGYVIYPRSWTQQWVITGLEKYAAYDVVSNFQTDPLGLDLSLLDMNTIFTTDIIQESLLRDGYASAQPLQPGDELEAEEHIRDHINGLIKYKAPAILRMLRLILGDPNTDYIQRAAQAMLSRIALEAIQATDFYGALTDVWSNEPIQMIDNIEEYLWPWVTARGFPLLSVGIRQGEILITQEQFGFTATSQENYIVPLTYTSNVNFDFNNIHPVQMMENTMTIRLALGEEDYVLFNVQGQGYYRVNYDDELWERIIEALEDPDQRAEIHPLNRATLVDDALNCARAGKLDYDIAFRVILAMEHETEYAPWKAFVRNMNFLRKRLVAMVTADEDLDPDIYLRMVRRTIGTFENEIGFYPDPNIIEPAMVSLTRGLVMNHACRANYAPCIAAAVDWFYDPNSNELTVNPDIPRDIRPAVYCTMVREGDAQVINALYDRLEIEPSHYERVVILESLACSQDENFIWSLLMETISGDSPHGVEERSKIFAAVVESSYDNARLAIQFMRMRAIEVRNMYGGPRKLEELIFVLAENAADNDLVFDLSVWINSVNSNIDESIDLAERALAQATEDLQWDNLFLQDVYDWIDENDAPKIALSVALLSITLFISLFNH